MKFYELKDYDIMDIEAMDDERLEKSESGKIQVTRVYIKSDVDAAIAELKQKLEDAKATAYTERVDAGMENRRLKRALWLAREQTAIEKHNHFALCHNHSTDLYLCINGASIPTESSTTMRLSSEWSMIWKRVVAKCRAKAEKYK